MRKDVYERTIAQTILIHEMMDLRFYGLCLILWKEGFDGHGLRWMVGSMLGEGGGRRARW